MSYPSDCRTPIERQDSGTSTVSVLSLMMVLIPALGVPNELMLQDTLKSAVAAFGILGAGGLMMWKHRHADTQFSWHGVLWLAIVLTAFALLSMAWSHTYLASVEAVRWFLWGLLLWIVANTVTLQNLPQLLLGMHAGAVVASVWAMCQFWFDFSAFPQGPGPSSTFANRNFLAEYLICVLPFSTWMLATQRRLTGLIGAGLSVVAMVLSIMMAGTRSALIGLLLFAPILVLILIRYREQLAWPTWNTPKWAVLALILMGGIGGLSQLPAGNLSTAADSAGATPWQRSFHRVASLGSASEYTEGSFSIRAIMWKATARMVSANPVVGVGAGAWEVEIPLYQRIGESGETDFYAHNEYLQLLAEFGLPVGGLVLAFLLAYLLICAGKTWRLNDDQQREAPLRAFTLLSVLMLLVVSSAGFPWRLAGTCALFALCLGLLAGSDSRLNINEPFFAKSFRWSARVNQSAMGFLLACGCVASYVFERAAASERHLVSAILMGNAQTIARFRQQTPSPQHEAQLLAHTWQGIAINPHYRKLTPLIGDQLAAKGDWANAVTVWESVVSSRPHILVIWSNLAKGYAQIGQYDQAFAALAQWRRLQPNAPGSMAVEVTLLNETGRAIQATQKILAALANQTFDFALLQAGYSIGYKTGNGTLAIQCLEARNQTWPEQAADGFMRLGKLHMDARLGDESRALQSFQSGLLAAPDHEKENYRSQVPEPYRSRL